MSTQAKRLDKVEGSLTPKQAAILWLREARQHADSTAYSRSLKGQPPAAFPMSVMDLQMEASLNAAMKGSPRSDIQRAIWQAQRDCIFLFKLVTTTNMLWYEHERALVIGRLALAAMLRPLLEHQVVGFGPKGKRRDDYLLGAQQFVRFMESFLSEVLVLRAALAAVAERYFDGEPVLFSGDAADIDEMVEGLEGIAVLYNDAMGDLLAARKHPELRAMTTVALEAVMGDAIPELVDYLVVRAKAEALTIFGETNAASDLMARYV